MKKQATTQYITITAYGKREKITRAAVYKRVYAGKLKLRYPYGPGKPMIEVK